jgi:hypothetical protein
MINICSQFVSLLKNDASLIAIVNPNNIYVGPVDIVKEQQSTLGFPLITIIPISEVWATVPLDTRQTRIQIDIWSRNSEMEAQSIYEQIIAALNYQSYDSSSSHIFWQRAAGANELSETEVRLWRYSTDLMIWSFQ